MGNEYFLHRISHEDNTSYSLLDKCYLTIGWELFADTNIMQASRKPDYQEFDAITDSKNQKTNRSRWCMWYFAQIKQDDYIVVPLYSGKFSVYRAIDSAKPINELENELNESFYGRWNNHPITWKEHRLFDEEDNRKVDLGFFVKVEKIVAEVPRNFVSGKLTSRMKIRTTTANISDIAKEIEEAVVAGKKSEPINLYEITMNELAVQLKDKIIKSKLNADRWEQLIQWYFLKIGADISVIPAKNESGKEDGADADIIAEFTNLKMIIYVQAKFHDGQTSEWAVEQISKYKNQKCDGEPDYIYATWVISSADEFSTEAIEAACINNVRLINGTEFTRMLLDVGLNNLNDAFNV